jgi:hypothetical protein
MKKRTKKKYKSKKSDPVLMVVVVCVVAMLLVAAIAYSAMQQRVIPGLQAQPKVSVPLVSISLPIWSLGNKRRR